jgi:ubiquinone/menaquinone biosynthesis C-methylase UbiE
MKEPITPVTRSKDQARTSYNRLSRWYDLVAGASEKKYRDYGLAKLNAQEGEHILEIGFGTGHCLLSLARSVGDSGKVYGIDLSEGMLAVSQNRIRDAGLADRVDLRLGDALSLPFASGSFDALFMSFTLELFDTPEIPELLRRCRAVLRPGGRLVVASLVKEAAVAVRLYEWFHRKMPVIVDCRPIYAQAALTGAGFDICDVTAFSMWGLPVEIILARSAFPELVETTGGGLLHRSEDPLDLAEKLATLLHDEKLRNKLRQWGRTAVYTHFSAERMAT